MDLTHEFTVPAAIGDAWAAFNDLERIAPCFPGASLTSYDGEAFEGLVKVKLGPISLQYSGTGRFAERDEAAHRAVIEAKGKDKRGNGTAAATITATLSSDGDAATNVSVATDLNITGKPAQFGRGLMQDVSDKLLAQFASCLETKLGESTPTPEGAKHRADGPTAPVDLGKSEQVDTQFGAKLREPPAPSSTGEAPKGPETPTATLDLGAAVVPVLLKRYAMHIIGGLVGLWLLRKIFGRRR